MFIAVFFIDANTWNKPRYPSADEQISILAYPDNGILLTAKKNGLSCQEKTWWILVCILSNRSEKPAYCITPTYREKSEAIKDSKRMNGIFY